MFIFLSIDNGKDDVKSYQKNNVKSKKLLSKRTVVGTRNWE